MRLYPGVDGMATNGLRYGASIELRENFPGSAAQPTPLLAPAPSGSTYTSGETVFVRRAFTYLAADNFGIVRFGQTDGVIGLFDPCIFYSGCWDAGIGNFNGGQMQGNGVTGGDGDPVRVAGAGRRRIRQQQDRLPVAAVLRLRLRRAVRAQHGQRLLDLHHGRRPWPSPPCNSQTTGTDGTRWYNQVGVGARYQGTFGPVSSRRLCLLRDGRKESVFGPSVSFARGNGAGNQFDNLSFLSAAGYVTFDTGVGTRDLGDRLHRRRVERPVGHAADRRRARERAS